MKVDVVQWKRAMRENPGELTAAMSHTALALTLWMDRDGGFNGKPPSQSTIAETVGKRRQAVAYALGLLAEAGWLEVLPRRGRPALLHAAIPDRLVAEAPFGTLAKGREPSIEAPTRKVEDQAYSVNPQSRGPGTRKEEAQVGASKSEYPQSRGPGPAKRRPTNSYPSLSNSLSTEVLTPDDHPDLWQRARVITEQRTDVGNPRAYQLRVYRQLVDESNGQRATQRHLDEIEACKECASNGWRLQPDGTAVRCDHGASEQQASEACAHIWHLGRDGLDVCRCGTKRPRTETTPP